MQYPPPCRAAMGRWHFDLSKCRWGYTFVDMISGPSQPKYKLARRLRREMSPPEVRLWLRIRSRKDTGVTIRRQHPIGPFVLDFYCPEARLAIEVDGAQHTFDDAVAHDARRDAWFSDQGIETMRLPAVHIMQDADAAADSVLEFIRERLIRPSPTVPD